MSDNPRILPAGAVIVLPSHAAWLTALCADGVHRWKSTGGKIPPDVLVTLDALKAIGRQHSPEPIHEPEPRSWIPTAEAAGSLAVSCRRVRALKEANTIGGTKIAGKLYLDAEDVHSLAEFRAQGNRGE